MRNAYRGGTSSGPTSEAIALFVEALLRASPPFHSSTSYFYLRAKEQPTVLPTLHSRECLDLRMHWRFLDLQVASAIVLIGIDVDYNNCI